MDDSYPVPRIEDQIVKQGRKKVFTIMDLKDALHQVPLKVESRPITNTTTPLGMMMWRVVVQGWKNGVQYCQRNVNATLEPVTSIACGYVDDILAGTGEDEGENLTVPQLLIKHDREMRKVLDRLVEHQWVVDPKKCKFFVKTVGFCGNQISEGVCRPAPGRMLPWLSGKFLRRFPL